MPKKRIPVSVRAAQSWRNKGRALQAIFNNLLKSAQAKKPGKMSLVVATILSLVIGTAVVPMAHAADRSDVITDGWIKRAVTKETPLIQNEVIDFGFTWDASTASPAIAEGDTITVTLPDWAQLPAAKATMRDSEDRPVAECVQTAWTAGSPATVVCTFTDFVTKEETRLDLKGEYKAQVSIRTVGELTPTFFEFGPAKVDLTTVADPKVIENGAVGRGPTTHGVGKVDRKDRKTGYFHGVANYTMGEAVIGWELWVGGVNGPITINDPMALPQEPAKYVRNMENFNESVRVRVRDVDAEGDAGGNWETAPDGTATFLPTDEFQVSWEKTATAHNLRVHIPNATANKYYRIQVYTGIPADSLVNGAQVGNTATMNGTEYTTTTTAKSMINAWASGSPDVGDLYIYKSVNSADGVTVDELATAKYQIKASWTHNGQAQSEIFTIPVLDPNDPNADATAGKLSKLPRGTEVTLEEVPLNDGATYSWKDVIVREGKYGSAVNTNVTDHGKGKATVVIKAGERIQVNFNNIYETKVGKVAVGDYVWVDTNKNGIQDAGEKGLAGVTLSLTGPDGKSVTDVNGQPVAPVKTDAEGKYTFANLPVLKAGESYTVTVGEVPAGYQATTGQATGSTTANDSATGSASSTGLTKDGEKDDTLDFGFVQGAVSVGDYVWVDANKNGIQDAGEKGLAGVTLSLTGPDGKSVTDVNGNPVGPVKTTDDGKYTFANLPVLKAGESYTVTVGEVPAGYQATTGQATGSTTANDSATGSASSTGLTKDGEKDDTLDFGFIRPSVSVGNYVWFDTNADGNQDADENGINDVQLRIIRTDGKPVTNLDGTPRTELTTITTRKDGKDGYYIFEDLPLLPDDVKYAVEVLAPRGYVPTVANAQTSTTASDSSTGSETAVQLVSDGDVDMTLDFGFVNGTVSVGDYVWIDTNNDGVQDDDEEGLNGVTLTIARSDNNKVLNPNNTERTELTTVTATKDGKAGYYSFSYLPILPEGVTYVVSVTTPEGYLPTVTPAGVDPARDSSTGSATAVELTRAGQNDPTLDFGFVRATGSIRLAKVVAGISGVLFNQGTEFPVSVTWLENNQEHTVPVTIRHGETVQLPNIPTGSVVTIKETLPGNNLIAQWRTPSFEVSVDGAVQNPDGSVTFTVPANTNPAEPVQAITVIITNVSHPPLWWIMLPLVPILVNVIPSVVPGSSRPNPVAGETTVPQPTPAPGAGETTTPNAHGGIATPNANGGQGGGATNANAGATAPQSGGGKTVAGGGNAASSKAAEPAKATGKKGLANTGASVLTINGLALLLILIGAYVAFRSRRAS